MRHSSTIIRSVGPLGAAALAVMLAGCGSSDSGDGSSDSSGDAASGSALVQTSDVSGVGTVLTDSSGRTLYFADEESGGDIKCVDACLGFWTPAEATGAVPSDIEGLGTMTRDDTGEKQLTYDGAPLYTFKLDKGPGQATGDDFSDSFSGVSFTWHAASTDESAEDSGDDSGDDSGGGNDGGYDYGGGY
jgi:predicted lipoprotein with Yx(FWY)xxD motif